ncbi:unnamed protein product [Strongylus vulgaris]|uniref:Uncharacterized protein n=1 Tax=Strongylus vulgaris TaxID=40348 RepID=A0A3P7I7D0_STRVU|nr:unnamed protein product [Strongylus vulgaris]
MLSGPVSGCTGRRPLDQKDTSIISCSAPTVPGHSPPTPMFTPFSKLQGASTIHTHLAGNKVKEDGCEADQ